MPDSTPEPAVPMVASDDAASRSASATASGTEMTELARLDDLVDLMVLGIPLYLRCSSGPDADAGCPTVDRVSGLPLPGHAAEPLRPPDWWTLPVQDWLARRLCHYPVRAAAEARPWVLAGEVVDFGPDNEPLLAHVKPIAWLTEDVLQEARERYTARLSAGRVTV
jgi:Family of unknown function (DUF6098)